jgi:hypothetical protein
MAHRHEITAADILPPAVYAAERVERRRAVVALKRQRRIAVGPFVTFYFENYDTMWFQIHEMLHIEKGGAAQIADELAAYNPLVPNGAELIATFMIEIDNPERRKTELVRLGGIEETAFLSFAGNTIQGRPEADQDRTTAEGKASSVQFVHFPFTAAEITRFKAAAEITLGFHHPNYRHSTVLPPEMRDALAGDFA